MRLDVGQIEAVDLAMAEVLRRKTPAERLAIAFGIWESARTMLLAMLTERYPERSPEEIRCEVTRRISHGAI